MPISIVNCHAPSSTKRTLTMDMRRRYFNAFHDACGADPFIWGGDFNTKVTQLTDLVERIANRYTMNPSDAQPGSLQVVFSHPLQCKHGDLALTFGLDTAQVNSEIGFSYKGVSDAHDLVVAKVFENTSRPAPRPESAASWSSSAAQPARQGPAGKVPNAEEPPESPMPTRRTPRSRAEVSAASSAAQPARQQCRGQAVPPFVFPGTEQPKQRMPARSTPRPQAEASPAPPTAAAEPRGGCSGACAGNR